MSYCISLWKDLKVRYKQTAIGVSWVLLQPLITMLIFTAVFGHLANVPSDGVWYPIFTFTGLLPWTYFAQAITRSSGSLVSDANMVRKIYFPRFFLPLATIVAPLVDLALSAGECYLRSWFIGDPYHVQSTRLTRIHPTGHAHRHGIRSLYFCHECQISGRGLYRSISGTGMDVCVPDCVPRQSRTRTVESAL